MESDSVLLGPQEYIILLVIIQITSTIQADWTASVSRELGSFDSSPSGTSI